MTDDQFNKMCAEILATCRRIEARCDEIGAMHRKAIAASEARLEHHKSK